MSQLDRSPLVPNTLSNPITDERLRDVESEVAVLKSEIAELKEDKKRRQSQNFQIFITVLGVVVAVGFNLISDGGGP